MLAGFLSELSPKISDIHISCCIPYDLDKVKARFPEVSWYPYTNESREEAIKACDVWLGLGGYPFQSSVSPWFIQHLVEEKGFTTKFRKPMAFLGIGSQDTEAFNNKDLMGVINTCDFINTRDSNTYNSLIDNAIIKNRVFLGADLGHLFFSHHLPQSAQKKRLTVVLNTDYKAWPNLNLIIENLENLNANEQLWLIQESRPLPGSEQSLLESLSPEVKTKWTPIFAEKPNESLSSIAASWPTGEWTLTSRYHTAIASFWGGSKTTILGINSKLNAVASEFGLTALPINAPKESILASLQEAKPVDRSLLLKHTSLAKASVAHFRSTFGL